MVYTRTFAPLLIFFNNNKESTVALSLFHICISQVIIIPSLQPHLAALFPQ